MILIKMKYIISPNNQEIKTLKLQKDLSGEPIYLEAALEYADIRTLLSSPENRLETALQQLRKIKEDFSPFSSVEKEENYGKNSLQFPNQYSLYQIYMKAIEAEILRLEACILRKQNFAHAENKETLAFTLFEEVALDPLTTPYLKKRVEFNMEALGYEREE